MLLRSIALVVLICSSFPELLPGANGQKPPPPEWFHRIEEDFDNASFPLRRCTRRSNLVPNPGGKCGPRSKTCFFGDQVCEGEVPYPHPAARCACNGTRARRGNWACDLEVCPSTSLEGCFDAVATEKNWYDIEKDDCTIYEILELCDDYGDIFGNFDLTANQACCACGGGTIDPTTSVCKDKTVAYDPPLPWLDSALEDCTFYAENPVTRCLGFANEKDTLLNLTVGEACCACKDIIPPSPPTCTDLPNWSVGDGATCSEFFNIDCLENPESFGILASEACCKCGQREGNPDAPTLFTPQLLPQTAGSCASDSSRFNMCIKAAPNVLPQDVEILNSAATRWSSIIVEDIPDFLYDFEVINTTGFGGSSSPVDAMGLDDFHSLICHFNPGFPLDTTDDMNLCVSQLQFVGTNILALATPIYGDNFARFGVIVLNANIMRDLRNNGTLLVENLMIHEIGHTLGVGSLWEVSSPGQINVNSTDCTYIGQNANRVYQELSGCPAGTTVPLEAPFLGNCSSIDGFVGNLTEDCTFCGRHASEECFTKEVMTSTPEPFNTTNPLSAITVAMLDDLGFTVDYSQADPFTTSDLSASCICDGGGGGPPTSTRSMLELEEFPMGDNTPMSDVRSDVLAYARLELKKMTDIAKTFMIKSEEKEGTDAAVAIGIPGMSVLYLEEDGSIQSVYVATRELE